VWMSASGLLGVPAVFDSSALESFELAGDASSLEPCACVSPMTGCRTSVQTFLAMLAAVLGAAAAWSLGARLALGVLSRLFDWAAASARRCRIPVSGNFVSAAMSGWSSPSPDPELELATLAEVRGPWPFAPLVLSGRDASAFGSSSSESSARGANGFGPSEFRLGSSSGSPC